MKTCRLLTIALALLLVAIPISANAYRYRQYYSPSVIALASTPTPTPTPITTTLQLGAFNAKTGTIQAYFVGWGDDVVCATGQTTFIYWENYGYSLDSIINGSQDGVIKNFAGKVCPNTIVSLFHEMNGNWSPWDGAHNSTTKVIAAYKHIHDLMGSKVKYAWVVNNVSVPDTASNRLENYYPGDNYVDYVGVDAFAFGRESFSQLVPTSLLTRLKAYNKPVWVTSFGYPSSSAQSNWITSVVTYAKSNNIGALIYFNYYDPDIDFRLTSASLAAFHQ